MYRNFNFTRNCVEAMRHLTPTMTNDQYSTFEDPTETMTMTSGESTQETIGSSMTSSTSRGTGFYFQCAVVAIGPKRTWREVFKEDCQARKLNTEDAMDRSKWRKLRKLIKDVR